jgi:N6-adenosine-specific RNA methylase IME4
MELRIKEEFKKLIPPLTAEEFKQLETNCIEEGIRDAIVTWQGFVIDGHNRYKIATDWQLSFKTIEKAFDSEEAVKEWMIINQFGRRNLSNYDRAKLGLELEDIFSKKAKANLKLAGQSYSPKEGFQKSEKVTTLFEEPIEKKPIEIKPVNTVKEVAKIANVSHDTIAKVKVIEQKAAPEVKEKLSTGEISINQAYQDIKKEEKKEQRVNEIKQQIEAIESGEMPELKGLFDIISFDPPWPYEGESKEITTYDPNGRRVANPYPEMSIEQIKQIEVPSSDNSVVFLWTTHKFLNDAFDILKTWGFQYKGTLVWDKEKMGMGAWLRMQCEFCLIGIKGKPYWDNTKYRDIIRESRREHSRKPDSFFEMVENITLGRKLEYFSREKRNGWEVFGNDINKF